MGSVSMQSQVGSRSEHLSAVVDGEWAGGPGHIGEFLAELSGAERAAWSEYHLIGDALRSDDLAVHPVASSNFLRGFAARLEAEPHVLAPAAAGARASALRAVKRRVIPGLAVAAAAATLSWIVLPQLQRADAPHAAVQMAAQPARHDAALQVAAAGGPAGSDGNIIRDAGLDQYLEAHQQFAQQPMVPGSAPFIRAAAMTTQGQ